MDLGLEGQQPLSCSVPQPGVCPVGLGWLGFHFLLSCMSGLLCAYFVAQDGLEPLVLLVPPPPVLGLQASCIVNGVLGIELGLCACPVSPRPTATAFAL